MLNENQIQENKNRFLELISRIEIPNADTEGLVNYLLSTDFFEAPASTMYHSNYQGGLCAHSLNVYDCLKNLCQMFVPNKYDESSLISVALLHDISKANFYEKSIVNKKVYDERGTKHDNLGNFSWVSQESFKVREPQKRFQAGEHGVNSMLLAGRYIPFNLEETSAIINHHFVNDNGMVIKDISAIYNCYDLATLLHVADMISTYIMEKPEVEYGSNASDQENQL